jgi:hypothetical protein
VDGGDFGGKANRIPEQRLPQQRRKAQLQLQSFALVGMDGLVPGPADLALGPAWLAEQAAAAGVPLVAANLKCKGLDPLPARTVVLGGLKVGLVGVLDDEEPVHPDCEVAAPGPAAARALAGLGELDLVVALSRLNPSKEPQLIEDVPQIEVVVAGGSLVARSEPRLLTGGAVHLEAGSRGKKVGVATIELAPGARGFGAASELEAAEEKLERSRKRAATAQQQLDKAQTEAQKARARRRVEYFEKKLPEEGAALAELQAQVAAQGPTHRIDYALVPLGDNVEDHEATAALLDVAKTDIERLALETRSPSQALRGPFVGSQVCRACHPDAFTQWSTTPHSSAWKTLVDERRQLDQDCYSCHSTGALHPEGPQTPAQVGKLENVGCESCHGPGREHITDPTHVDMVASPGEAVCVQCHDGEQDEGRFDLTGYLPKVRHGK